MNKNTPLLSIVIPTKNRYDTLLLVLDSIIAIKDPELEIVVQDNSDDNKKVLNYLARIQDNRIKYFYSTESISQTGNSDLAVKHSTGEFVCFIGDDDGVMPYIIKITQWMKKNGVECIRGLKPGYFWPKMNLTVTSTNETGFVRIKNNFNYKINKIEGQQMLNKALSFGGTSILGLPVLYHGIVSRKILNKIYTKTKSFFPGPSPDMANAVALCLVLKSYYYLDFPIIISGKSVHSIGGKGILHQHINRLEDVEHLPKTTVLEWNNRIPKYWTGPTIWAASMLKSLSRMGNPNLGERMNYPFLYANIYLFHYNHRKTIFSGFEYKYRGTSFYTYLFYLFLKRSYFYIKNRVNHPGTSKYSGISNIQQAIDCIYSNHIDMNKILKLNTHEIQ